MATRRESVTLSLVDAGFSTGMAKAAAAAALLDKTLDDLGGSTVGNTKATTENTKATEENTRSKQRSKKSTQEFTLEQAIAAERTNRLNKALREQARAVLDAEAGITAVVDDNDRLAESAIRGSSAIDRYSGRMGLLVKTAAALGPALIPIGAVAVPAVTGLAAQLGLAAIAAGTAVAAFQGVGDALTAVNKAELEPTVENLRAAREELMRLSPAGRDLVAQMAEMKPILTSLRDTAQEGLFPGLIEGFESLERLAPTVDGILRTVSETLGDLFADGAESLAGDRWADFFSMLASEARPVLTDMGHALGDVVHGLSEMWEAFAPLNRDFGSWIADVADDFDRWATGLSQTDGFQEFIAYIRENGPLVAEATSAIANAVLQIVQAAAPLGGPVLKAITAIADAFATIADSPLGTPIMAAVTAMSALSLASKAATASITATNAAMVRLGATSRATAATGAAGAAGAGAAGLPVLAGFLGVSNIIEETEALVEGRMDQMEYAWRRLIPFIGVAEDFGIKIPGFTDDVEESGKAFGHLGEMSEVAMDNLDLLGASYEEVRSEGEKFTRGLRMQAREMRRLERTKEQVREFRDAIREENQAMQDAAEGFVDFGRKADRSKFTLDGWLDKLEKQTRAMRNFRHNAEQAAEKGLAQGLIKQLRRMGPEGALQLERLADASETEIDRANRAWRNFQRESRLAGSEVENTRLKLHALGGTKAKPKVEVDNKQALTATDAAKQALANVADMKPNPKINVTSNASAAAAATAAALNQIADEEVVIRVRRQMLSSLGTSNLAALGTSADGGTVPRTGLPYADRHPYLLADGEEVISNRFGQADRHRELLKAINANRLADGGTAGVPVRMRGMGGGGTSTVHHTFEVVVRGEMDLSKAKVQLGRAMRDEIEQDREFARSQGN